MIGVWSGRGPRDTRTDLGSLHGVGLDEGVGWIAQSRLNSLMASTGSDQPEARYRDGKAGDLYGYLFYHFQGTWLLAYL